MCEVDAANATNIAAFVNDSLIILWPEGLLFLFMYFNTCLYFKSFFIAGIEYDHVLVAITDAAPYMVAAMRSLKTLFYKMLHITCFAHGLHRVCEFIRSEYEDVNKLISCIKSIFV